MSKILPALSSHLCILGCGSTSDNLDQFSSNDSLSCSVVQDLELVNHVSGVLGGVVHGVATSGDFTSVALGESPEQGIGESVLAEVAKNRVIDFKAGEVC